MAGRFGTHLKAGFVVFSIFTTVNTHAQNQSGQKVTFEVASIKPSPPGATGEDWDSGGGRVTIKAYSLRKLIQAAYDLKSDAEVIGGADWLDKTRFDINAKMPDDDVVAASRAKADPESAIHLMLQALLEERFELRVRSVEKEMPVLALVVKSRHMGLTPDEQQQPGLSSRNGTMTAKATTMPELAVFLSRTREVGQRSVIDHTDLPGKYDFSLNWTPERGAGVPSDSVNPGLFTALSEQLGLQLKAAKSKIPVIEVTAARLPTYD